MTKEYLDKIIQFVNAAFALVAGLAWNTAIQNLINRYIAPGDGLKSQFLYAGIVTTIAVLVTVYLAKFHDRIIAREERAEARREAKKEK